MSDNSVAIGEVAPRFRTKMKPYVFWEIHGG